ncbi:MAG: hypothetical protein HGA65_01315 [Oscillochloris sp.]|nr:hypothetical protein [Oscillochloris sp.]
MFFLVWYDPDARRSVAEKIQDARDAYLRRFTSTSNLALVSITDTASLPGVEVRSQCTVQQNHFWVGRVESLDLAHVTQEGESSDDEITQG